MILTADHVTAAMAHEREKITLFRARVAVNLHRNLPHLRRHVLALAALEVCRDHGAEILVLNRAREALESYREQAHQGATHPLAGGPSGPDAGAADGGPDPGGPGQGG